MLTTTSRTYSKRLERQAELEYSYKEDEDAREKITIKLQCFISDVKMSMNTRVAGYIIKLEPKNNNKLLGSRKHRPCTFQFRYDFR